MTTNFKQILLTSFLTSVLLITFMLSIIFFHILIKDKFINAEAITIYKEQECLK